MLLVLIWSGGGHIKHTLEDFSSEEPEVENVLSELMLLLTGGKIDGKVKESEHGQISERLPSFLDKFDDKNEKLLIENNKESIDVVLKKTEFNEKKYKDHSAVKLALSVLLGENPSEENKLTAEQLAAIIQLDELLQEKERNKTAKAPKLQDLAKTGVVTRAEYGNTSAVFTHSEDKKLNQLLNDNLEIALENVLSELLLLENTENNVKESKQEELNKKRDEEQSAVQEALSVLLGENPSAENKLTVEEIAAIIKLDDFLQKEERKEKAQVKKIENLVEKAIGFVDGAVTLREKVERD